MLALHPAAEQRHWGINQKFSIILDPEEDGFCAVRIPAIPEIVTRSRNSTFLPGNPPNDPADRITIATARAGGMAVVTRDLKILDYAAGGVEPLGC